MLKIRGVIYQRHNHARTARSTGVRRFFSSRQRLLHFQWRKPSPVDVMVTWRRIYFYGKYRPVFYCWLSWPDINVNELNRDTIETIDDESHHEPIKYRDRVLYFISNVHFGHAARFQHFNWTVIVFLNERVYYFPVFLVSSIAVSQFEHSCLECETFTSKFL